MKLVTTFLCLLVWSWISLPAFAGWDESPQALARYQAIQEVAVRFSLLDTVRTYPQLVEAFHEENRRRAAMKARGEVIYGPVQFRQEVWFAVWEDQLFRALCRQAPVPGGQHLSRPEREAIARDWVQEELTRETGRILESSFSQY